MASFGSNTTSGGGSYSAPAKQWTPPPAVAPSSGAAAGASAGASVGSSAPSGGGAPSKPAAPSGPPPALQHLLGVGAQQASQLWGQAQTVVGMSAKWGVSVNDLYNQIDKPPAGLGTAIKVAVMGTSAEAQAAQQVSGPIKTADPGVLPSVAHPSSIPAHQLPAQTFGNPIAKATVSGPISQGQSRPLDFGAPAVNAAGGAAKAIGKSLSGAFGPQTQPTPQVPGTPPAGVVGGGLVNKVANLFGGGSAPVQGAAQPSPKVDLASQITAGAVKQGNFPSLTLTPPDSAAAMGATNQRGLGIAPYNAGEINKLVGQAPAPAPSPAPSAQGWSNPVPGFNAPGSPAAAAPTASAPGSFASPKDLATGLGGIATALAVGGKLNQAGAVAGAGLSTLGAKPPKPSGSGQLTNPGGLTVKGTAMSATQQHWANQIIQIGRQLHAPPLAIQAALYAAAHESNLGGDQSAMTSANSSGYGGLMQGNKSWVLPNGQYDHAGQIKAFFLGDSARPGGGTGFEQGGAINLAKQGITNPAEIAVKVEVPSIWPQNAYASQGYPTSSGLAEAAKTLQAAGGAASQPQPLWSLNQQLGGVLQKQAAQQSKGQSRTATAIASIFPPGTQIHWDRQDQGRDAQALYNGKPAPVIANGAGVLLSNGNNAGGFGTNYPIVHFTSGPWAGQDVYFGHTDSHLQPGQHFNAGDTISQTGDGTGSTVGNATGIVGHVEVGLAPGGSPGSWGQPLPPGLDSQGSKVTVGGGTDLSQLFSKFPAPPPSATSSGSAPSGTSSASPSSGTSSGSAASSSSGAATGATAADQIVNGLLGTGNTGSGQNPWLTYFQQNTPKDLFGSGTGSSGNPFAISLAQKGLQSLAGVKLTNPLSTSRKVA